MRDIGKLLLLSGGILVALGLLFMFSDRIPLIGKLPGDITIRRGSTQIIIPLASCIVLSVLISLILWAISLWRGK